MPPSRVSKTQVVKKRGPRTSGSTNVSQDMADEKPITFEATRSNSTHIFFWQGPLSNWYTASPKFSGAKALQICLPRFDAIDVVHPSPSAFATRLISDHDFNCGEQWMMACKAWLMERDLEIAEKDKGDMTDEEYRNLRNTMMGDNIPAEQLHSSVADMWKSTLCRILRSDSPRDHKALGRKAQNFNEELWDKASGPIVIASCVARAQSDPLLRDIYLDSGVRKFVEGSPMDKIWGVGIKWNNTAIENEKNWKGENRLGLCHDEARNILLQAEA